MTAKSCLGRAPESFLKYRLWRTFDLLEGFEEIEEYVEEVPGDQPTQPPPGDPSDVAGPTAPAGEGAQARIDQERGRTRIAAPDFQARKTSSRR